MKKFVILLIIVLTVIFITGCAFDEIHYCPYCGKANISGTEQEGVFKCNSCDKVFGAKRLQVKD